MLFTKMHGLGNNYVLFDLLKSQFNNQDISQLSMKISDVNFGIGSDGIILIGPSSIADFQMRIFNSDGSEAKNCGNGLRCTAKYLFDHNHAKAKRFTIETLGGVVQAEVEIDQGQTVQYVTVNMGEPKFLRSEIPLIGHPLDKAINEQFVIGNEIYHLTCVSMGNPHAILFVDDVHEFPLEQIGPIIENSYFFPDRVNVGIVHVVNNCEIQYRVWERGSGLTMACGTGACAAVVAATINNRLDKNIPITVHLPGGDLTVKWDHQNQVWKKGPAEYICSGDIKIPTLF
ncbi:diaminopimelate epimerase [Bacillus sp. JJ1773]|uniref:diaminopimelate epimerase n=1 Tax=Bacillus sp. JJ1773 TaxID=3122965 RepID=UPI002FFF9471